MKYKKDLLFVAIVIIVVVGLVYLDKTGKHPQPTSLAIPEHQKMTDMAKRDDCLVCHDPEKGSKPIAVTHPQKWRDEKFPCIGCHKLQPAASSSKAAFSFDLSVQR